MNYRHAFHAGNFADLLKHTALIELLRLLTRKDKPLLVVDTHAGRGGYDLGAVPAARTAEAAGGIHRLMAAGERGAPEPVKRYLAAVRGYDRKFGPARRPLSHYPGSPRLVRGLLRPGDRFVACELQGGEAQALRREFAGDKAIEVRETDGLKALRALLPPRERRALVFVDPPFEKPDEFERLARELGQARRRLATGCYAIWYPLKDPVAVATFEASLPAGWLRLELALPDGAVPAGKLAACALAIVNPPWTFAEVLEEALAWIAARIEGRFSVALRPAGAPASRSSDSKSSANG